MKNNVIIGATRCVAIIAILILAQSCLEYTVKTTVNKDGSLIREYIVTGDSSKIFDGSLWIPTGSSWNITRKYEENDKTKDASEKLYVYTASRKFGSIQELQQWLDSDTASNHVRIKVSLKKHFRWFYTEYEFTETYPMSFPFRKVPIDKYMTKIEQSVVKGDGDAIYAPAEKKMIWRKDSLRFKYDRNDSMAIKEIENQCEKKLENWMALSVVTEFSDLLKDSFGHDQSITALADKMAGDQSLRDTINHISGDTLITRLLVDLGDSLAGSKKLSVLYAQNRRVFRDFEQKGRLLEQIDFTDSYEYYLAMPGETTSTNADNRDHQQLWWKFEPVNFLMADFVMQTTSRVPNIWMMILTGLVAACLVLVLLRRRR